MMSHESRHRFDLTRTLACNWMTAAVLCCGGCAADDSIDFNTSRDFTYVLLMLEIDDLIWCRSSIRQYIKLRILFLLASNKCSIVWMRIDNRLSHCSIPLPCITTLYEQQTVNLNVCHICIVLHGHRAVFFCIVMLVNLSMQLSLLKITDHCSYFKVSMYTQTHKGNTCAKMHVHTHTHANTYACVSVCLWERERILTLKFGHWLIYMTSKREWMMQRKGQAITTLTSKTRTKKWPENENRC